MVLGRRFLWRLSGGSVEKAGRQSHNESMSIGRSFAIKSDKRLFYGIPLDQIIKEQLVFPSGSSSLSWLYKLAHLFPFKPNTILFLFVCSPTVRLFVFHSVYSSQPQLLSSSLSSTTLLLLQTSVLLYVTVTVLYPLRRTTRRLRPLRDRQSTAREMSLRSASIRTRMRRWAS